MWIVVGRARVVWHCRHTWVEVFSSNLQTSHCQYAVMACLFLIGSLRVIRPGAEGTATALTGLG